MTVKRKALVLGAYGLIGAACCRALLAAGFEVTGGGRSARAAQRVLLGLPWVTADLARPLDWAGLVAGYDVVINASGALQDGLRDDLEAIHVTALSNLVKVLEGADTRLVHISAAGVSEHSETEFFRSKARGDAVLKASDVDFVILRPTLVIGPDAYGGTALLRATAGMPLVEPVVMPDARVSCVALEDVAGAVVQAAEGGIAKGTIADLTEAESRDFPETVTILRNWLGFEPWSRRLRVPGVVLQGIGMGADLLGWLGWRSPLRTTAIRQLHSGIEGDPEPWRRAGGRDCAPLPQILARMTATRQERLFARMWVMTPVTVAILSLFWIFSGLIGFAQRDAAAEVLTSRGFGLTSAMSFVLIGAVIDLGLGLAILWRAAAQWACLGMVAVSLGYLGAGTLMTPDLWADPLGPFVKVLPGIALALTGYILLEEP